MKSCFWDNVFSVLNKLDKSQIWLSNESGVGNTLINSGIARSSSPWVDTAVKIAKTLGTSVEFLVTGQDVLDDDQRALLRAFNRLNPEGKKAALVTVEGLFSGYPFVYNA